MRGSSPARSPQLRRPPGIPATYCINVDPWDKSHLSQGRLSYHDQANMKTLAIAPLLPSQLQACASKCLSLQSQAQDLHSKRPFAALLLAPDNTTTLMTSNSLSHVRHAESELARNAADNYDWDYLSRCTLVSTWEPCAMCSGTIYWAHIGRLVYLASEKALQGVIGNGNEENLTMDLPCREVFERGQFSVEVIGPVVEGGWEERVVEDSRRYWDAISASKPLKELRLILS